MACGKIININDDDSLFFSRFLLHDSADEISMFCAGGEVGYDRWVTVLLFLFLSFALVIVIQRKKA